jgi:hypothetical protein
VNGCLLGRRPAAVDSSVIPNSLRVIGDVGTVVACDEPSGSLIGAVAPPRPPDGVVQGVFVQVSGLVLVVAGADVRLLLGEQLIERLAGLLLLRGTAGPDRCRPALSPGGPASVSDESRTS